MLVIKDNLTEKKRVTVYANGQFLYLMYRYSSRLWFLLCLPHELLFLLSWYTGSAKQKVALEKQPFI